MMHNPGFRPTDILIKNVIEITMKLQNLLLVFERLLSEDL